MGFLMKSIRLINQPIRTRFYISYLIILLIPLIAIGIIISAILGGIVLEQVERTYINNLNNLQNSIESEFEELNRFAIKASPQVSEISMKHQTPETLSGSAGIGNTPCL